MKKVITYGTFDLFHEGHYNILKRAKALGDYLIVGVTSESYDIERGKLNVRDSLLKRIENVRRTGFADEIIIEEYQGQKLSDIIKYKVDLLVLGSDVYKRQGWEHADHFTSPCRPCENGMPGTAGKCNRADHDLRYRCMAPDYLLSIYVHKHFRKRNCVEYTGTGSGI